MEKKRSKGVSFLGWFIVITSPITIFDTFKLLFQQDMNKVFVGMGLIISIIGIRPTNPSMNRFNSAVKYCIIITILRRNVDEENLSIKAAMAKASFRSTYKRLINLPILQKSKYQPKQFLRMA
jgi:hypothetical protein